MTETKMQLEDWLDDLCVRFIINLPREELESVERICFQVEEAQWFYEDFIRPLDPALPSLSLKAFALRIFQHCPLMANWSRYHHTAAFSEFLAYKTRVPVRGAILLNHEMDEVVLVKGWKKGANWSFPRGKINKDEKDLDCAIREVYEETGYDVREAGLVKDEEDVKFIEITMREQHMRLYVFRGVPQGTYFEPRTRKEISKIEWWKLSDLPTLKKSKQYDEGQAAANANKFYMVAPFLHPLKKWIAQQKKLGTRTRLDIKQPTDGEISMDDGLQATTVGSIPNPVPPELAVPSDLPEVAATHDASAHLKRLLNINNGLTAQGTVNSFNVDPNASKSNALLELLRSGTSLNPTPQGPRNEQELPSAPPPSGFFPGFPQQYVGPPGPQGNAPQATRPYGDPSHSPFPAGNRSFPQPLQGYSGAHQAGPSHLYQQPITHPRSSTSGFQPVSGQTPAPGPYQRTGDPQFSHSAQPPQIQAAVPPASKLPPPKLTSHSLALLSVFRDEKKQTPQTANAKLAPRPEPSPSKERKPSHHQDQLLSLLKGSPLTSGPRPAELSAYPASPAQKHILQRPNVNSNHAQQAPKGALTSATVSGPLNTPHFEAIQKPSGRKTNEPRNRASRERQTQPLASPITILPRPQSARREQTPIPGPARSPQPHSQPRPIKTKSPEPPKMFQPQILRRSDKMDVQSILPVRTKDTEGTSRVNDLPESPDAKAARAPQPDAHRRPSQTAAQRETLLSLFGKPATSSKISPPGQLNLQTSGSKPLATPSVVSPLTPLHHTTGNETSAEDGASNANKTIMIRPRTSPRLICTRCSSQWRAFSTTRQPRAQDIAPPPPQDGYARLTNRGLISITGVDSTTFLQGLITQNMFIANDPNRRVRHTGSYSAFLNSTGRILNDAFIYPLPQSEGASPDEPAWLVEVDRDEVPSLLKHLKKHKLRAKLKLRALEEGERTVWASWKNHLEPRWAAYNLESPTSSLFPGLESGSVVGCIDTRAPGFGSRLVTPGAEDLRTHILDEAQVAGEEVDLTVYTIRRILHGVAEGQSEIIRESSLPLESNMDMMKGIDFRKGCYVGQELTIRTHHTGVVRKRILPVQLYEGDGGAPASADGPVYDPSIKLSLPPSGSNISKISARRGRSAGKFLGGIGNIGLALCRLETMTDIALTSEGSQFSPDQEFKASWSEPEGSAEGQNSGEVKIKAIVPPWTRDFITSAGGKGNTSREGHRARDYLEQLEEEEAQR
ncbi:decapping enzyme complex catalytic subunit DCP2 [Aspergillus lucknowensis]|uniref:Iron-sulfur cluster assembly factor IBA57 homolog, mitochondrial n=1 Tax=Aspergillus lucknowensis TaxID=176173 RepID=A0ABR4LJL9_9EURO